MRSRSPKSSAASAARDAVVIRRTGPGASPAYSPPVTLDAPHQTGDLDAARRDCEPSRSAPEASPRPRLAPITGSATRRGGSRGTRRRCTNAPRGSAAPPPAPSASAGAATSQRSRRTRAVSPTRCPARQPPAMSMSRPSNLIRRRRAVSLDQAGAFARDAAEPPTAVRGSASRRWPLPRRRDLSFDLAKRSRFSQAAPRAEPAVPRRGRRGAGRGGGAGPLMKAEPDPIPRSWRRGRGWSASSAPSNPCARDRASGNRRRAACTRTGRGARGRPRHAGRHPSSQRAVPDGILGLGGRRDRAAPNLPPGGGLPVCDGGERAHRQPRRARHAGDVRALVRRGAGRPAAARGKPPDRDRSRLSAGRAVQPLRRIAARAALPVEPAGASRRWCRRSSWSSARGS